jgi:rhamnopyranosyl-N-acetylglucosaminyl-diphospho-decaprenol beta-1,3/1,4-galactofuranosyltransferase
MSSLGSMAAIVTTYDRKHLLGPCLEALQAQTHPLDEIVVVDNGSSDGTGEFVRSSFPTLTVVRVEENRGFGMGLGTGLRHARERGHEWMWLFDDDDRPKPIALERLVAALAEIDEPRLGMLGFWGVGGDGRLVVEGETWDGGRRRKRPPAGPPSSPYRVDLLTFSGMLLLGKVVEAIGLPRTDYYLMYEDVEYCLRAQAAGFRAYVVPEPLGIMLRAGSAGEKHYPPWRAYYQTRNDLLMARQHGSVSELWWWAVRQARFLVATILWLDRRSERIRYRLLGAWHGLRGIAGRTVVPS